MQGDKGGKAQDEANEKLVPRALDTGLSLTTVGDAGFAASKSPVEDPALVAQRQLELHTQKADSQSYLSRLLSPLSGDDSKSYKELEAALKRYQQSSLPADAALAAKGLNEAVMRDQEVLKHKEEITGYGTGFIKTMALFSRFKVGTAAIYAFDQANPKDGLNLQLTDGTLGAAKGLALNYVFNKAGANPEMGLAGKAVTLGVGSRAAETMLTRQTYFDANGDTSLSHVWSKAKDNIANPTLLASDVIFFGMAHGLVKSGNVLTRGLIERNAVASTVSTAGSFGLISGANHEVQRQLAEGKTHSTLDLMSVLKGGLIQGGLDLAAGVPGGIRSAYEMRPRQESMQSPESRFPVVRMGENTAMKGEAARLIEMPETVMGTAKGGKEKLPPLWHFDKAEALQRVYDHPDGAKAVVRSPLKEIEPIDDFAGRVHKETSKWEHDLTAMDSTVALKHAALRVHQELIQNMAHELSLPAHLFQHPKQIREILTNDPQRMGEYVEYLKALHDHGQAHKGLNDRINQRVKDLNLSVNEFAALNSLPSPLLETMRTDYAAATYRTGTGKIQLQASDFLNGEKPGVVAERTYHEFTHFEQDVVMVRHIADRLLVGKTAGQAEAESVQRVYRIKTGTELSPEFLRQVLDVRKGQALSPEQAERAELLMQSFLQNNPASRFFQESGNDYRVVASMIRQLEGRNGAFLAVTKLSENGAQHNKRLLGQEQLPVWAQTHVDNLRRYESGEFDTFLERQPEIKSDIKARLLQRLSDINERRKEAFANYMQPHEQEAWLLGHWAQLRAANYRATTGGEKHSSSDG